jgi:hypothetical protein
MLDRILVFPLMVIVGGFSLASYGSAQVQAFHQLIEANYQLVVFEWKGEGEQTLMDVVEANCDNFNKAEHLEFDRTNEVGTAIERMLKEAFEEKDITCVVPITRSGRRQTTGYPDLEIELDGKPFYLEVKVFSSETIRSGQRTFYFTASENPKVTRDAYHLLVGFELQKSNDSNYRILRYHISDLRNLPCKVKIEYNASNRDMYGNPDLGHSITIPIQND